MSPQAHTWEINLSNKKKGSTVFLHLESHSSLWKTVSNVIKYPEFGELLLMTALHWNVHSDGFVVMSICFPRETLHLHFLFSAKWIFKNVQMSPGSLLEQIHPFMLVRLVVITPCESCDAEISKFTCLCFHCVGGPYNIYIEVKTSEKRAV